MAETTAYQRWCIQHGCSHGHCVCGCDHPQPFMNHAGVLLCAVCRFEDHAECVMVPCTPEHCVDTGGEAHA